MRRCYLVCYDIRDPKRLQRVFKTLKGYGEHWQLSVFYCVLKNIDRIRMEEDMKAIMNLKEDQALIIDMGNNDEAARSSVVVLGESLPEIEGNTLVI